MSGELAMLNIGKWILTKILDKGFDSIVGKISNNDEINIAFNKAFKKTADEIQSKHPDVLGNSLYVFFKKDEIYNELFKMLFKSSRVNISIIEKHFDTSSLPKNLILDFINSLRTELLKYRIFDEILSDNQLFFIFQGLDANIQVIAENSLISVETLSAIYDTIQTRIGQRFDYEKFKRIYSENAINNLSQISFIGLGIDISIKKNRKKLNDVFVEPLFELSDRGNPDLYQLQNIFSDSITFDDIFAAGKKIVILGNPGSGKSMVLKSIVCDILQRKEARFKGNLVDYLPFRIELRNYLSYKKKNHVNICKYLLSLLETDYQVTNLTEEILSTILSSKNCIMLFDGLDEIFDISDKIAIKNDIENFHNNFDNIFSITTSRIIGYEDASLNEDFQVIQIKHFNIDKIQEYVKKWYDKEEEVADIREREVNGFLSKMHEIDGELTSNPLLLSLIVIIYRNILKLPESKLEIYQSCTKTLVDKWDASKDLVINLDERLLKEKEKLFADLAHWQYDQLSSKETAITFVKARQTVAKTIRRLNIADEDTSESLAEEFMEYAQKRSLYFDNTFTHKTFLEYYTAYWIYSNIEKKHNVDERNRIISKYIGNSFWFIVLELLLNLIDKDQADTDIIDDIYKIQIRDNPAGIPFLINMSLQLKNISDISIRDCIITGVDQLFCKKIRENMYRSRVDNNLFSSLSKAIRYSTKAKAFFDKHITEMERIYSQNMSELIKVYALKIELNNVDFNKGMDFFKFENPATYREATLSNAYLYLLDKSISMEYPQYIVDTLDEFIRLFGIQKIFEELISFYDDYHFGSYFSGFMHSVFSSPINKMEQMIIILNNLGITNSDIIDNINRSLHGYFISESQKKSLLKAFEATENLEICEMIYLAILKETFDIKIPLENLSEAKKQMITRIEQQNIEKSITL
ncbi:NACHT domain-containing protein [Sphingobacterium corticis]